MPSFDAINYSLRPSKSIQRQIVFSGLRLLQRTLGLSNQVYVGFGSIWFTDFVMAHKLLGIDDMVSLEADDIGYKRAVFNSPYATIKVAHGYSYTELPKLYVDATLNGRPWVVWLDYDYELNESLRDDIRSVIENAPANSIFLVTFNGIDRRYGDGSARPERIRELLGSVVPDSLTKAQCKTPLLQASLADLTLDYMKSVAADRARPGGFVSGFRVLYRDGPHMITVGGVLPDKEHLSAAEEVLAAGEPYWPCFPATPIEAPHLTIREAALLQSQLPCSAPLTRAIVKTLGFDLEDSQIDAFARYYREYPAYAQILT
ncbi:MAG: hypothetical protein KGZ68_05105 [Dechloromonas sp.]|nr:hypothetical protein [Dechloromonas sp.]